MANSNIPQPLGFSANDMNDHLDVHDINKAFLVISDGPPALTSRQLKAKRESCPAILDPATKQLILNAYPPLHPSESETARLARASAMDHCWTTIESRVKAALGSTDALVFDELLALARNCHLTPSAASVLPQYGLHRVPTGLVLTGGVNSAEHVDTLPGLARHLRTAGCYVAMLNPTLFSRSLGEALNAALRQLSGLDDTSADAFDALLSWYYDETGAGLKDHMPPRASKRQRTVGSVPEGKNMRRGKTAGRSAGRPSTSGNERPGGVTNAAAAAMDENTGASPSGGCEDVDGNADALPRRVLRERPPTSSAATGATLPGTTEHIASEEQVAHRERPVVFILESSETVNPAMLEDLIVLLSTHRPRLPVTLMLHITTTATALNALLPSQTIDRCLQCRHYKLATALSRLDTLVAQVMLGKWPGLLLERSVVSALWDAFLESYFSPSIVVQGWKLAALAHFRANSFSVLARASIQGDASREDDEYVCKALAEIGNDAATQEGLYGGVQKKGKRISARQTSENGRIGAVVSEDDVIAMMHAWRGWAVGLHWMVAAASAAGLTNGYTYWQLYRDALNPGFVESVAGKELFGRLERLLKRFGVFSAVALIARLLELGTNAAQGEFAKSKNVEESICELETLKLRIESSLKDDGKHNTAGWSGVTHAAQRNTEDVQQRAAASGEAVKTTNHSPPQPKDLPQGANTRLSDAALLPNNGNDHPTQPPPVANGHHPASRKRHERYFSKSSRREALLNNAKDKAQRRNVGSNAAANKHAPDAEMNARNDDPGALLADWLMPVLRRYLSRPPTTMPGAAPFVCRDVSALDCLTAAPREAIHTALTKPQLFLQRQGSSLSISRRDCQTAVAGPSHAAIDEEGRELGVSKEMEDVCLAYSIFDQDPVACSNVVDWFTSFLEVHAAGTAAASPAEAKTKVGAARKSAHKGAKKTKGDVDEETAKANASPRRKASSVSQKKTAMEGNEKTPQGAINRELAARFSQAVSELQYMGFLRSGKQRKGDHVARAVHMPAPLFGA